MVDAVRIWILQRVARVKDLRMCWCASTSIRKGWMRQSLRRGCGHLRHRLRVYHIVSSTTNWTAGLVPASRGFEYFVAFRKLTSTGNATSSKPEPNSRNEVKKMSMEATAASLVVNSYNLGSVAAVCKWIFGLRSMHSQLGRGPLSKRQIDTLAFEHI